MVYSFGVTINEENVKMEIISTQRLTEFEKYVIVSLCNELYGKNFSISYLKQVLRKINPKLASKIIIPIKK